MWVGVKVCILLLCVAVTCQLQAFVRLEALPGIPRERREAYADLAIRIFQQFPPADPYSLTENREQQRGTATARLQGKGKLESSGLDDVAASNDQVIGTCALCSTHPSQCALPQHHTDQTVNQHGERSCPLTPRLHCMHLSLALPFQVCVASGKTLRDEPRLRCKTCKHAMMTMELGDRTSCPLCHSKLHRHQEAAKSSSSSSSLSRNSSIASSSRSAVVGKSRT